jgi:hypothetical protein
MANERYAAEQLWLQEYVGFTRAVETTTQAERQMALAGIGLPEVFDVMENGEIVWADREFEWCRFILVGRNCDDEEIEVCGRFSSSEFFVVIDEVTHTG